MDPGSQVESNSTERDELPTAPAESTPAAPAAPSAAAAVGHVTRLVHGDKEIFLIGTAHVSRKSVEEVERVIHELRPDTVCVELDEQRFRMLEDDRSWKKLDIFQVIRQKRVLFLLSSLALSAYQKRLGDKLGVRPGAELLAGVHAARAVGAELVLADRDVQATLKRTWANLSFWDKAQISSGLMAVPFSMDEIDEERIEELKDQDTIGEMMHEVAKQFPRVKEPLIDERDAYLMSSIQEAPGRRIVGVVGAAHVAGMVARLGQPADRLELSKLPPPSKLAAVLGWLIPALVIGSFYFGFRNQSWQGLEQMLFAWILPTGLLSAIFTVAALGHPLTVLTAFIAAPITTLHPALGAGMVTGLLEAYLRKPTVEDCEGIQAAFSSLRGLYQNSATRVLLVFVGSTIGAALGAWIGASWVISLL
ncbi:MAG TPA: TraB/GumN family protein [Polyangiaceae bacterium]|nr:TraB/GumN family protein [Polyangiaceae bacterium]